MRSLSVVALLPLALLAGCGGERDAAATGASPDEARQLNEAAAMLDANSVSPAAVNATDPDKESQP